MVQVVVLIPALEGAYTLVQAEVYTPALEVVYTLAQAEVYTPAPEGAYTLVPEEVYILARAVECIQVRRNIVVISRLGLFSSSIYFKMGMIAKRD